MLYDIRLTLRYDYDAPVHGGRHLIRVSPPTLPGVQRLVASSLTIDPPPEQQTVFTDFFGNPVSAVGFGAPHDRLEVNLSARVQVEERDPPVDLALSRTELQAEIQRVWSLAPDSPHHFLWPSPRLAAVPEITAYAGVATQDAPSVLAIARSLCLAIHRDFTYESGSTDVETTPAEAFSMRRGVCQDFAQVMIAGLRGLGIPAGYVSGFLRTIPPKDKPRLEGADAMHAWVRVWCGQTMGWVDFDPTNAILAGADHITIGYGRDYADVSPIVGVLKTNGSHEAAQSVDVLQVQ